MEQPILEEENINISAIIEETVEKKDYLKQKIISLEKFNLEYQYDNLNNNEINNILDLYNKNYNEKIDDKKSKINLFTGISLVIIFGLLALIIFVSTFISIVQSTINSKGQSFKIDLYQVLVSNNTSGTIQYIPTPLQLL